MGDLISRSAVINKIRGIVPGSQDVDFIVRLIGEQPTAYDIEKVVEEVQNVRLPLASQKARIIGIVRKGGAE